MQGWQRHLVQGLIPRVAEAQGLQSARQGHLLQGLREGVAEAQHLKAARERHVIQWPKGQGEEAYVNRSHLHKTLYNRLSIIVIVIIVA